MNENKIFKQIINDKTQISALLNLALKPISMILSFVYIPLLITYLGTEKYGLWATMLSIISWINYCDVGVGQGLRNLLSKELTHNQYKDAQRTISTAYFIITIISTIMLAISICIISSANLYKLFNTSIDLKIPLYICFAFICLNFILALCNMVLFALQLSEQVAIRNCITQVLNILGLFFLKSFSSENLIYVSILFGFTSSITYIYTSCNLIKKYPFLNLDYTKIDSKKIKDISNLGIKFFLVQIPLIIISSMDNLLVTHLYGASSTTVYSVANSVFHAAASLFGAYIVPYWSQTTVAMARGDINWIKKASKRLNILAILFNSILVIIYLLFDIVINIWLGRDLVFPPYLVGSMCLYYCLYSIIIANVQLINGTGFLNVQLVMNIIYGISYIPLAFLLSTKLGFGVLGIRIVGIVFNLLGVIIYPLNLIYILKKLKYSNHIS